MREKVQKMANANCGAEVTIAVIGGYWKTSIIKFLAAETLRFGELSRRLPAMTARMLTRQLRELEEDLVIHREVFQQVPPKVEYSLTDYGRSLLPLIDSLNSWGMRYTEDFTAGTTPTTPRVRV